MIYTLFLTIALSLKLTNKEDLSTLALCLEDTEVLLETASEIGYDLDEFLDALK
jgi:hypothetical protein